MTALLLADGLVALAVLLFALRNLNAITRSTSHWVRTANALLAVGAFAIVAAGLYPDVADDARAAGHFAVLVAVVMLMCFGRRQCDRASA